MSNQTVRKKEAESSREKLIVSAERLFSAHGFDGVSVRDIANAAGVNSALVGCYFRGKEASRREFVSRFRLRYLSFAFSLFSLPLAGQQLSTQWENLTAADFVKGLEAAHHVCLLPFGIIEKHGPSGPLGTDLINVRAATLEAAAKEYAIIFPSYYFGQIAEARHQPGTVAYHADLQLALLQATVDEMSRNGCRKIVIVNGHGGNNALLQYFLQVQLDTEHNFVVYVENSLGPGAGAALPAAAKPSAAGVDGHAGEEEIAGIMANAPGVAHPERAGEESGADQQRLHLPPGLSTPIWWYASFPNHYQGNAAGATAARGEALRHVKAASIAEAIKFVKEDTISPELQARFFKAAADPAATPK